MLTRVIAQLKNKRILVLGAGLTGMSCVRFLTKHQLTCSVNDSRASVVNTSEFQQSFPNCDLVLGHWEHSLIAHADVILVSPGVDLHAEQLTQFIKTDCQLMGDVELFCQITEKPIIAVTGSNGKSTVVSLLTHVGRSLGLNIALAGNIGTPVLEQLSDELDYYVLELSSFQLETVKSMNAASATVLNISDDHLDRHGTIENYSQIKQRIYQQTATSVVNRDEPNSYSTLNVTEHKTKIISFGSDKPNGDNFGLAQHNNDCFLTFGDNKLINTNTLPLAGMHNALNYLAVLALGYSAGWSLERMLTSLADFNGLPHRCQRIATNDNVIWINDSKATNVGAALAAINGLSSTICSNNQLILLAGGDGKGADFAPLISAINSDVSAVFAIGKDGRELVAQSKNGKFVDTIETAVQYANDIAKAGDIVLLSPACASIDMFANFAERGQRFTEAVIALQEAS